MIRKIVSSIAVLLLSGCVYYVPYEVAATEPWTDEPVAYEEPVVVYETYRVSPYYPWASVDYFYLGTNYYWPASSIAFSFGFYGGGGWYPPYYGPFYYSAWYSPFYGYPYYYPYAYAYSRAGYDYWDQRYPSRSYRPSYNDQDGHHGGNGGGRDGGRGEQGNGRYGNAAGNGNYGNSADGGIRSSNYRSLDRHGQVTRQPGQARTAQPGQNKVAPSRTGMPAGLGRPAPVVKSSGGQLVSQQTPAAPAQLPQSAPQPPPTQRMAPQPVRTRPDSNYSRQPGGSQARGQSKPDGAGDGSPFGDRDKH